MTPPTPVQNSHTSFERDQGRYEEEGRRWNAREGTIIARTKQFLERSYGVKVRVEELEGLLGPEDVDVDFRRILKESRDERGPKIFETFSSNDMSFLVSGRDGTNTKEHHHGDKSRRHLQVMDGGNKPRNS